MLSDKDFSHPTLADLILDNIFPQNQAGRTTSRDPRGLVLCQLATAH